MAAPSGDIVEAAVLPCAHPSNSLWVYTPPSRKIKHLPHYSRR